MTLKPNEFIVIGSQKVEASASPADNTKLAELALLNHEIDVAQTNYDAALSQLAKIGSGKNALCTITTKRDWPSTHQGQLAFAYNSNVPSQITIRFMLLGVTVDSAYVTPSMTVVFNAVSDLLSPEPGAELTELNEALTNAFDTLEKFRDALRALDEFFRGLKNQIVHLINWRDAKNDEADGTTYPNLWGRVIEAQSQVGLDDPTPRIYRLKVLVLAPEQMRGTTTRLYSYPELGSQWAPASKITVTS